MHVRTGWKTIHHRVDRFGVQTTTRSGPCHFHRDAFNSNTLVLDAYTYDRCVATWFVRIPSRAMNVRHSMNAHADAWLDWGGSKAHGALRTSRGVRFYAMANNLAALDVVAVHASWDTRKRI